MQEQDLSGHTVAVPETRELDVFCAMLERRGARVWRCPLVAIKDAPDPDPIIAWVRAFCNDSFDDLILLTGEGLRRLLGCIERNAPEMRDPFVAALGRVRIITRGPKPGRVLRDLALKPSLLAASPTTEGVIATLSRENLQGRRVGVQLYGAEPNQRLMDFLRDAGADAYAVAPYIYADAADDVQVRELIAALAEGRVDTIAFTSMAQVERLFRVAEAAEEADALRAGLARAIVAAVGPVVADTLRARGVEVDVMPGESYFLKPMTSALAALLAEQRDAGQAGA
jgi:uroporphyrinogen-III synthase